MEQLETGWTRRGGLDQKQQTGSEAADWIRSSRLDQKQQVRPPAVACVAGQNIAAWQQLGSRLPE
jgi:hypothetical protein